MNFVTARKELHNTVHYRSDFEVERGMKTFRKRLRLLATALLAGLHLHAGALAAAFDEYQVKSAFLFHFTQFVNWPDSAFSSSDSPIIIGLLGHDPFGANLDRIVRGEVVRGRQLVVKRLSSVRKAKDCHIVFVSSSETSRIRGILATLRAANVLTVGETDTFCPLGGVVNLVTQRERIGIEVNPDAAKRAGLRINSRLMKLAKLVKEKD